MTKTAGAIRVVFVLFIITLAFCLHPLFGMLILFSLLAAD